MLFCAKLLTHAGPSRSIRATVRLEDVTILSRSVAITLRKPSNVEQTVNMTLTTSGPSDDLNNVAQWTVLNTSRLRERMISRDGVQWLRLPAVNGEATGSVQVQVPLVLSATGLSERVAQYRELLFIRVQSSLSTAIATTQQLDVALTVQAATSFAVWRRIRWDAQQQEHCVRSSRVVSQGTAIVGEVRREVFSACDAESLPVNHQDPFSASVVAASAQHSSTPTIEYDSNGVYEILLTLQVHGNASVILSLSGEDLSTLVSFAVCPPDRRPRPDGSCGCPAGFVSDGARCTQCAAGSFRDNKRTDCAPCALGTFSPEGGKSACTSCAAGEYQDSEGKVKCKKCPTGYSSVGASAICSICDAGFFRPSVDSSSETECTDCIDYSGLACGLNATTATVNVTSGYWRHSTLTVETHVCKSSGSWSPCFGGLDAGHDGNGYCASGFHGPRCELCDGQAMYFDKLDASCRRCDDVGTQAAVVFSIFVCLLLATAGSGITFVVIRRRKHLRIGTALLKYARSMRKIWQRSGMRFKVKGMREKLELDVCSIAAT